MTPAATPAGPMGERVSPAQFQWGMSKRSTNVGSRGRMVEHRAHYPLVQVRQGPFHTPTGAALGVTTCPCSMGHPVLCLSMPQSLAATQGITVRAPVAKVHLRAFPLPRTPRWFKLFQPPHVERKHGGCCQADFSVASEGENSVPPLFVRGRPVLEMLYDLGGVLVM